MGTKMKHTPGPWGANQLGELCGVDGSRILVSSKHFSLGIASSTPERDANARLIAAAPDLLAALETAVGHVDASAFRENVPWLKSARAAIAKAKSCK